VSMVGLVRRALPARCRFFRSGELERNVQRAEDSPG